MKICIVGGGSAGWMSASTFSRLLPNDEVTLVESLDVDTSGVGESTLERIRSWLDIIGAWEDDFVKEVDGTFKHSIKFTDFLRKDGGSFHYPFGEHTQFNPESWWAYYHMYNDACPKYDYRYDLDHALNEKKTIPLGEYAETVNPLAMCAEMGRFDRSSAKAYHIDSAKFVEYLKKTFCDRVTHISSNVVGCEQSNDGISSVILDNGENIEADLFVDCTGFKSLLLGEFLQEPFTSYDHLIPNDSAWATHVPYNDKNKQMVAYTECTAIDNGWVWQIPLWTNIGTGYVYSSKYISDDEAKQQFIDHLEDKGFDTSGCEFKHIPMRIGRYKRSFVKNVVAIGMSAGFIEPLESNGLLTVHDNLIDLYKTLRRGQPSELIKEYYNKATSLRFDEFADFVAVHYAFTQRQDTPYWRDIFNKDYDITGEGNYERFGLTAFSLDLYKFNQFSHLDKGFHYIASGMGVCPYINPRVSDGRVNDMLGKKKEWRQLTKHNLPTMYKYLKDNIYEVPHINDEPEMREILEEKDKKEKLRTKNTPLREDLHLIGKTGKE